MNFKKLHTILVFNNDSSHATETAVQRFIQRFSGGP